MTAPRLVESYYARCVRAAPAQPQGTILTQRGEIRLAPDRKWIPFEATQTLSAAESRFEWRARFTMAPLMKGVVVDSYAAGKGFLGAKLWGLIPIARGRGPVADRSEAQRYLAELVWCPMAFFHNPELHFEVIEPNVIKVWIGDPQTYVDWLFDEEGDLVGARTTTRSRTETVTHPGRAASRRSKTLGESARPLEARCGGTHRKDVSSTGAAR